MTGEGGGGGGGGESVEGECGVDGEEGGGGLFGEGEVEGDGAEELGGYHHGDTVYVRNVSIIVMNGQIGHGLDRMRFGGLELGLAIAQEEDIDRRKWSVDCSREIEGEIWRSCFEGDGRVRVHGWQFAVSIRIRASVDSCCCGWGWQEGMCAFADPPRLLVAREEELPVAELFEVLGDVHGEGDVGQRRACRRTVSGGTSTKGKGEDEPAGPNLA